MDHSDRSYVVTRVTTQTAKMNGARLASPIRGELGYGHRPQLVPKSIALLGTKFGVH